MNAKELLALWGLKWDPSSPQLPGDALLVTPGIEHFAWRVEQLALHLVVLGQPQPGGRGGDSGRVTGRQQRSGHRIRGVETLLFRAGMETPPTSSGMSVLRSMVQVPARARRATPMSRLESSSFGARRMSSLTLNGRQHERRVSRRSRDRFGVL